MASGGLGRLGKEQLLMSWYVTSLWKWMGRVLWIDVGQMETGKYRVFFGFFGPIRTYTCLGYAFLILVASIIICPINDTKINDCTIWTLLATPRPSLFRNVQHIFWLKSLWFLESPFPPFGQCSKIGQRSNSLIEIALLIVCLSVFNTKLTWNSKRDWTGNQNKYWSQNATYDRR